MDIILFVRLITQASRGVIASSCSGAVQQEESGAEVRKAVEEKRWISLMSSPESRVFMEDLSSE